VPAALQQSKRIEIARLQSFVELEKITQADANFDWTVFTKNIWTDTDEPTGSELEAGPGSKRRLEENLGFDVGGRRTNRVGGQFEATQNLSLNHTNSTFFNPQDRGIARLTMRYTQPLLRDGGRLVNEGQVILAQLQAEATNATYQAEINDVLQRVVQAYWELYRSRADYCIRKALVSDTQELLKELERRRRIDAQPALIAQVESQLNGQLADLGAAVVRIQRAQYELVRQVGDRSLDAPLELIPQEIPLAEPIQLDLTSVFSTAIQNRGELRSALKKIQGSQFSKDIAQNQLLPRLAMILETSAAGINGDYKAFESFGDQFSERAPTYSIGFTYEYPVGNRAAQSRARQANITLAREMVTFEDTIDQIRKEVRDSVASLEGYVGQAQKRKEAAVLADLEVKALLERRLKFPAEFDQVSQLYIRTYLDALQRRAQAEQALVSAHVDYSLSLVQLRRALGVLVSVGPT
jgi:outer membrane protein